MKKHIILTIIALCIFTACTVFNVSEETEVQENMLNNSTTTNNGTSESSAENPVSSRFSIEAEPLTAEEEAVFVSAIADLTVGLFKRSFAEKSDENTLVSPLSVLLALAMTANGAEGTTLEEMETVLGRGIALADLNQLLASYVSNLPSEDGSRLNIANSIWLYDDEGFVVQDDFLKINTEFYAAEIRNAPFNQDTVDEINDWVSRMTDEMITEILDEISPNSVMHLINAIAFDSAWEEPYKEHQVRKRDFTAFDGSVTETDFLHSTEYTYIETSNATGFLKSYIGGHYSFAALLPNENVRIEDFISDMTSESLMSALNSAHMYYDGVITQIPKFTFEYDLEMNGVLTTMGMPTAFSPSEADFSRLGSSARGNIFINRVLHKTFIEVDEHGTRAAAVTAVEMNDESEPEYKYVFLDRPFVFAIIDNATNLPVFVGALMEIPK